MNLQRELTVEDYLGILRRRWLVIAMLTAVGGGLGFGATQILPKRFTSATLVLVEQPTISEGLVPQVMTSDTTERFASMQQQILSRSRLEPIIQQFKLYGEAASRVPMEDLVGRLRAAIDVSAVQPMAQTRAQGLPGFTINVTFGDAAMAQQICSTVTSMFMEENLTLQRNKAEQTTAFLVSQLEDAKAKLDEQDARLAAFQRSHLGSLPDDQTTNLNVLTGLSAQLDAATQALNRAQQDKSFAESSVAQQRAAWLAALDGTNPETRAQQIATLEAQLAVLKAKYTDSHPDVVRLKNDIAAARRNAEASEQEDAAAAKPARAPAEPLQIQALRTQIRQYDQIIRDRMEQQEEIQRRIRLYQARVESTPAVEQEYKGLTRDYQTALEGYNDLLKKRDQAEMATALQRQQQGEQFRVLDAASLPDKPSFPDRLKFSLGGIGGGLALGLGLTLLLEMRDTSVRTDKDVEALLHLPVLAVVPQLKKTTTSNAKANLSLKPVA